MLLSDILDGILPSSEIPNLEILGVKTNAQEIQKGDLFLAIQGVKFDRHLAIPEALENGAVAIVHSREIENSENISVPLIKVADVNAVYHKIFQNFYGNPQRELKILGVTGTDGKTSTAQIVQQLIGENRCGFIGTLGAFGGDFAEETNNTTPDSEKTYYYLRKFVDAGLKYCIMEFSSEAQHYNRNQDLKFDVLGLTNVSSEHLDVHKTLENYVQSKIAVFGNHLKEQASAVLNFEDPHFAEFAKQIPETVKIIKYGLAPDSNNMIGLESYELRTNCTILNLTDQNQKYQVKSPLLANFNVYNLLCATGICIGAGLELSEFIDKIPELNIRGRLDIIELGQDFLVVIDFAHTPNGVRKILEFARSLNLGDIICVIGQAGGRDTSKRADVGKITTSLADFTIFTMDDPREENPADIISQMIQDLPETHNEYTRIIDRPLAIQTALKRAQKDDIVLLLGKGSENFMYMPSGKVPYSEHTEAILALHEIIAANE